MVNFSGWLALSKGLSARATVISETLLCSATVMTGAEDVDCRVAVNPPAMGPLSERSLISVSGDAIRSPVAP